MRSIFPAPVAVQHTTLWPWWHGAALNPPQREPAAPVVVVEVADQHLQRAVRVRERRRHVLEDGVEERLEGHARRG